MKKTITILFVVATISALIGGCESCGDWINNKKNITEIQTDDSDFKKLLSEIIPIDTSFREHYEISREHKGKALDELKNGRELHADFQVEALKNIKRAQRDLE